MGRHFLTILFIVFSIRLWSQDSVNAMDKLVEKITQNKTITPDSKKILRDMLLNLVTEVRSFIKNPVRRAERNERIANAYNKTLAVVKDQFGIEIYRAL